MTGCERIIKEGILSIFFESETICGFYVDEKRSVGQISTSYYYIG